MDAGLIVALAGALMLGLAGGWLAWGRAGAALGRERDEWRDKFGRAIADLNLALGETKQMTALRDDLAEARRAADGARAAAASAEAARAAVTADRDAVAGQVGELRAALDAARIRLGVLDTEKAAFVERERALEARIAELKSIRDAMPVQFSDLAGKALADAQAAFLQRAEERFAQAGDVNEAKVKALLGPVETTLKRYEDGLQRIEQERNMSYAALREAVDQVRIGQVQVKEEAARLVNALRSSPKARGRWGEQTLRNVLEQAGLSPYADFRSEVSVTTEEGRLRPDVIVSLPGGRQLIIDAKCSLNAYLDASEAVDEAVRVGHLRAHAAALRTHADQLGRKAYWEQFGDAADYVVMFIPGEHFLSAALEQDDGLWQWAFERKVLLATPTNLVAIARTVAGVWRQEKLALEARAIGLLGKEMYDRLAIAGQHLKRVGSGLGSAVDNYNKFVGSFERNVLSTARKFRELNIETGSRELEEVTRIEALAREPAIDPPALEPAREAAE